MTPTLEVPQMADPVDHIALTIQLEQPEPDALRLEEKTLSLRRELLAVDVDSVENAPGSVSPPGSRGVDAATVGTLIVGVTSSAWALTQVINTVKGWVRRSPHATGVHISVGDSVLTLSAAPNERQRELVAEFLDQVLPAAGGQS